MLGRKQDAKEKDRRISKNYRRPKINREADIIVLKYCVFVIDATFDMS